MKARIFQQVIYWPTFLILKLFFGFKVRGRENLKGLENESVIFVSNHRTHLDGFVCSAAMPREKFAPTHFFPITFMVSELYCNLHKNPFPVPIKQMCVHFLKVNEVIPVPEMGKNKKEKKAVFQFLEEATEKIKRNKLKVWVFPEGRLNRSSEDLLRLRRGFFELHRLSDAVVVPVGISGLKTPRLFRRITVNIGKPISEVNSHERLENEIKNLLKI